MERIENRTFDELKIGDSASLVHTLTYKDIQFFAAMSGDVNPAHVDPAFAKDDMFHKIIAHGMWGGALFSTVLGTELPGPGADLSRPVVAIPPSGWPRRYDHRGSASCGEEYREASCHARLRGEKPKRRNGNHRHSRGDRSDRENFPATRRASRSRIARERPRVSGCSLKRHGACSRSVRPSCIPWIQSRLFAAIEAAREGLIVPVLVGPEHKIRAAAEMAKLDLASYEVVPTEHSAAAANQAVALARAGQVSALMKGALHTDELMHAVVDAANGLRTARRISHVFAMDAPAYPRPLFITDAAINMYPTLEDKRDIVQNAIDLVHALRQMLKDAPSSRQLKDRTRAAAGRDPVRSRNGNGETQIHPGCCGPLQDGRPRADYGGHFGWAARL